MNGLIERFHLMSSNSQNISTKLGASSLSTTQNIVEQVDSVNFTVTATDQITVILDQNKDAVQATNELSKQNRLEADEGIKIMHKMLEEIKAVELSYQDIKKEIEQSNLEMSKVSHLISQIGEKTIIINDIVFQTKLLSFNASVEAARAGESGKGFAVVAEEIGKLAKTSGEASTVIAELVTNSSSQVKEIIEAVSRRTERIVGAGLSSVSEAVTIGNLCEKSFSNVRDNFAKIDIKIDGLQVSIAEQAESVQSIANSMRKIQDLSSKSQENMKIVDLESKGLTEQSQEIQIAVSDLEKTVKGKTAKF